MFQQNVLHSIPKIPSIRLVTNSKDGSRVTFCVKCKMTTNCLVDYSRPRKFIKPPSLGFILEEAVPSTYIHAWKGFHGVSY